MGPNKQVKTDTEVTENIFTILGVENDSTTCLGEPSNEPKKKTPTGIKSRTNK
jgi:hypothetical protein